MLLLLLLFRRPGRGSDSRSKCHIEKQWLFRAIRFCAFSEEPGEPNLRHRTHASETGWISANFNPDPAWKNACNDLVQFFFVCVSNNRRKNKFNSLARFEVTCGPAIFACVQIKSAPRELNRRIFSGDRFDANTHIFGFTLKCKLWMFDPQFVDRAFQYFMIFALGRWGKTRKRDSHPVRVNLQSCFCCDQLSQGENINN